MKKTTANLYQKFMHAMPYAICSVLLICGNANCAVVERGAAKAASAATNRVTGNMARTQTANAAITTAAAPVAEPEPTVEQNPETVVDDVVDEIAEPEIVIENKSSQFDTILNKSGTGTTDAAADRLAEQIRRQRAALDTQDTTTAARERTQSALTAGKSVCDDGLRKCMQSKCGDDYSKCAGDSDTIWGSKIESCHRDLKCTGTEFVAYAAEIKADRDMNARLAEFDAIINCGKQYDACIMQKCGTTYNNCLAKKDGDAAISACATIAKNCTKQDSGLASRTMSVFGTLRQAAEAQVAKDEKRLYALRDEMKSQCNRMGAMFDERSLDCVYTVSLYAGDDATLYASKKVYAGNKFDCTQNWFGIDITTFKENAYRTTREQTSASNALMGAGLGTMAGMVTSGMLDRAIDRQTADKAVKDAKNSDGGADKSDKQAEREADKEQKQADRDTRKEQRQENRAEKQKERQENRDKKQAEKTNKQTTQ